MAAPTAARTRTASVLLATLGGLYLLRVADPPGGLGYLGPAAAFVGALSLLAAVKLWCRTCFESHLVGVLVATGTVTGQLLVAAAGLPGGGDVAWSGGRLMMLTLSVAAVALLGRGAWRPGLRRAGHPYAR